VTTKIKKKVSFKKGFYIPVTVINVYQSNIKIRIDKTCLIISSELLQGTSFKVGLELIKVISEYEWNSLM